MQRPLASPVTRDSGIPDRLRDGSETATPASSNLTPARASMASASSSRSEMRALPTFPAPRTPTRTGAGTCDERGFIDGKLPSGVQTEEVLLVLPAHDHAVATL